MQINILLNNRALITETLRQYFDRYSPEKYTAAMLGLCMHACSRIVRSIFNFQNYILIVYKEFYLAMNLGNYVQ